MKKLLLLLLTALPLTVGAVEPFSNYTGIVDVHCGGANGAHGALEAKWNIDMTFDGIGTGTFTGDGIEFMQLVTAYDVTVDCPFTYTTDPLTQVVTLSVTNCVTDQITHFHSGVQQLAGGATWTTSTGFNLEMVFPGALGGRVNAILRTPQPSIKISESNGFSGSNKFCSWNGVFVAESDS